MNNPTRTRTATSDGTPSPKVSWPSDSEIRHRGFFLLAAPFLLLSAYPLLHALGSFGSAEFFAGVRTTGAFLAMSAASGFSARFLGMGRRFYLFVGIAFLIAGVEDLALGFLEPAATHFRLVPTETFLRNEIGLRTLTPLLLALPLVFSAWDGVSRAPGREIRRALLSTPPLAGLAFLAALAAPSFPHFSRSLDLLSAVFFATSLLLYFREYRRTGSRTIWWLGLSIGFMTAGRFLMLASAEFSDPLFGAARIYTIIGYTVSLLGFSLNQISVEDDQNWTIFRMSAEVDRVNAIYLEDVVLKNMREITDSHMATILAMSKLAESRDDETGKHIERTRKLCSVLATKLREYPSYSSVIDDAFVQNIFYAASLHDIGKVGIPDAVLLKEGKLSEEEMETIKRHPGIGASTLERVRIKYPGNEFLNMGIELTRFHHEKWDGTGYPDGLAGEEIPPSARIMALVDVYDALRSKRPYKNAFSHEQACEIIRKGEGTNFDPSVVEAFVAVEATFRSLWEEGIPL